MSNFADGLHVAHRAGDDGDRAVTAHEIDGMLRFIRILSNPELGALRQGCVEDDLRQMIAAVEHANEKSFPAAVKNIL